MAARYLSLVSGKFTQLIALVTSTGAGDADKLVSTGSDGKLDPSVMPAGIGAATISATASEALSAGDFVNFHNATGTFSMRKADNSNGRPAQGFVKAAVASAAVGTAYPMDSFNTNVTGLTVGTEYYLGTAGGVIATPLDEATQAGTGKVSQYLGIAKSATELITEDRTPVLL